jgi:hypothetical protein
MCLFLPCLYVCVRLHLVSVVEGERVSCQAVSVFQIALVPLPGLDHLLAEPVGDMGGGGGGEKGIRQRLEGIGWDR